MKDDTKYLLLGAAVIGGGYWWYKKNQKKTVTPVQTYLVGTLSGQQGGAVVDPLSIALYRFCQNPMGVTSGEKILIIEEVIRPVYLEESPAYANDAGAVAYSDALFNKVANRVSIAYCNGTTPDRVAQAAAWAREVWIAEEKPGAGFS